MIESKIYIQISNFIEIQHKKRVYVHIALLPMEVNKQSAFPSSFYYCIASIFYIISSYFHSAQFTGEFLAIYLAPNAFCWSKPYDQQPLK